MYESKRRKEKTQQIKRARLNGRTKKIKEHTQKELKTKQQRQKNETQKTAAILF